MSQSKRGIFYLMVFFSGFAGLLYQILWMRQLGLLLGNTPMPLPSHSEFFSWD
jgi:hypothetical protein